MPRADFDGASSSSKQYGSMHDTSSIPRVANFFVGSSGGATNATNTSALSILEDVSDIEAADDDSDERIRPSATLPEENPAFVNDDDESTTNAVHQHV